MLDSKVRGTAVIDFPPPFGDPAFPHLMGDRDARLLKGYLSAIEASTGGACGPNVVNLMDELRESIKAESGNERRKLGRA